MVNIKRLTVTRYQSNCYILRSAGEAVVIDPGGDTGIIRKALANAKCKYIINTHYHPDHTGAAADMRKITGAAMIIHKADEEQVDFNIDRFLNDGVKIIVSDIMLKVIHTPGHSRGSICLFGDKYIFTGDTLFYDGIGRTDLPGGSSDDLRRSLGKLSGIIKPGMTVYPGHGEEFRYEEGMIERLTAMYFP